MSGAFAFGRAPAPRADALRSEAASRRVAAVFAAVARFDGVLRDVAFEPALVRLFAAADAVVLRATPFFAPAFLATAFFVADFFAAAFGPVDFFLAPPRVADVRFVDAPRFVDAARFVGAPREVAERALADFAVFDFADARVDFVRRFVVAIVFLRLRVDGRVDSRT